MIGEGRGRGSVYSHVIHTSVAIFGDSQGLFWQLGGLGCRGCCAGVGGNRLEVMINDMTFLFHSFSLYEGNYYFTVFSKQAKLYRIIVDMDRKQTEILVN